MGAFTYLSLFDFQAKKNGLVPAPSSSNLIIFQNSKRPILFMRIIIEVNGGDCHMESTEKQSILQVSKVYQEAWNKHDAKLIASLFTDDGVFVDPWGNVSLGKAEIEAGFQKIFKLMPGATTTSKLADISESLRMLAANLALAEGNFENYSADDSFSMKGYSVYVLKNVDGRWLFLHLNQKLFPPTYPSRAIG